MRRNLNNLTDNALVYISTLKWSMNRWTIHLIALARGQNFSTEDVLSIVGIDPSIRYLALGFSESNTPNLHLFSKRDAQNVIVLSIPRSAKLAWNLGDASEQIEPTILFKFPTMENLGIEIPFSLFVLVQLTSPGPPHIKNFPFLEYFTAEAMLRARQVPSCIRHHRGKTLFDRANQFRQTRSFDAVADLGIFLPKSKFFGQNFSEGWPRETSPEYGKNRQKWRLQFKIA